MPQLYRQYRKRFYELPALVLGGLLLLTGSYQINAQPKIEHWLTSHGSGVYFVRVTELPLVDIAVLFDAGSARDGLHHGLAAFVAEMLEEGAGTYEAREIYRRFASVGAEYRAAANLDRAGVFLRSLSEEASLLSALETFITVLSHPNFPKDSLERLRRERLTSISRRREDPGVVAAIRFAQEVYKGHPYAHPVGGYEHSVESISRSAVNDFYERYYTADNLKLVFVGDLNNSRVASIANRISGALGRGNKPSPLPKVANLTASTVVRIDYPARQTHVLIGQPATQAGDPLNIPLYLGNYILGGSGFGSRLLEEIRVQRGLAYDAHSYFYPRLSRGPFMAAFQSRNDQAGTAMQVMEQVLEQFVSEGPSEKELNLAKRSITGGFPLRFTSNSDLMRQVVHIAFYDLSVATLDTYISRIQAQSRESVLAAFRELLNFHNTVTVMVGEVGEKSP